MTKDRLEWVISGINGELLTDWEQNFLEDIEEYFKNNGDLTEKQEAIVERLYREKGF